MILYLVILLWLEGFEPVSALSCQINSMFYLLWTLFSGLYSSEYRYTELGWHLIYVRLTYIWSDSLRYFKTCRYGDSNWIRDLKYVKKIIDQKGLLIYFWSRLYLLGPLIPYYSWLILIYKNIFLNQLNLSEKENRIFKLRILGRT